MRIPSYDDLTPSIPDVSAAEVFASIDRLLPASGPVVGAGPLPVDRERPGTASQLCACLRSARLPDVVFDIARDFSPRIQRYGDEAVVLDVSGLGRLLGSPGTIGAELARSAAARAAGDPRVAVPLPRAAQEPTRQIPRYVSRYGLRIEPHPSALGRFCSEAWTDGSRTAGVDSGGPDDRSDQAHVQALLQRAGIRVAVAPTQVAALLLSLAGPPLTVVSVREVEVLAPLDLQVLQQFLAGIHGVTVLRKKPTAPGPARHSVWPGWPACEQAFDVLRRWGLTTLGELAALPAVDVSERMGQTGVALQRLARGVDPRPLVPDPDVPRFVERLELEWPIDGLEPLSFVLARLLEPLSSALERADRAAAAIRLELRLVDRSAHVRMLQLPVALRDARVLRTLLLLDLESHPPSAAIDIVAVEIDPAPGRVIQYSLLERALPSAETLATLAARLGALVGDARCGSPVVLDTHRPDAFEMRRFDAASPARRPDGHRPGRTSGPARATPCIRRFRPPVAVRVRVERGRPAHVAIDRRGMPGGEVVQSAGPWRSSGGWWQHDAPWDRDEWDVELSDGSVCRLFREAAGWFVEGVMD